MAQGQSFYGKTVPDAVANACKELAASQEELEIEVLETGSPGIFGLCRKKAHIRVTKKERPAAEPAKEPQKRKEKPVREKRKKVAEPERPVAPEPAGREEAERPLEEMEPPPLKELGPYVPPSAEAIAVVRSDVQALLELMGCPSAVTAELDNQTVVCKISGEHQETLTGQEGRTLDSLQYLLRKMTSKLLPERTKLSIEVGDYRERRMEALKQQVLELAAKVREDGMTQAIPALNPSERRVVHMVLQDDKEVRSRSVGDGLFKKVLIYKPGKKKPSPARRGGKGRQDGSPSED